MAYDSDLTNAQWEKIKYMFEEARGKHLAKYSKKDLVDACLYITRTGAQWRQLPNNYPNWKTVYSFFMRARRKGLWEKLSKEVVEMAREKDGKKKVQMKQSLTVKVQNHLMYVKTKGSMVIKKSKVEKEALL